MEYQHTTFYLLKQRENWLGKGKDKNLARKRNFMVSKVSKVELLLRNNHAHLTSSSITDIAGAPATASCKDGKGKVTLTMSGSVSAMKRMNAMRK
jgi:hypothetical protein